MNPFKNHPAFTLSGHALGHPVNAVLRDELVNCLNHPLDDEIARQIKNMLSYYLAQLRDQSTLAVSRSKATQHPLIQKGLVQIDDDALVSYRDDNAGGAYVQVWITAANPEKPVNNHTTDDWDTLGHVVSGRMRWMITTILQQLPKESPSYSALQRALEQYQQALNTQKNYQWVRDSTAASLLLEDHGLELDTTALVRPLDADPNQLMVSAWLWVPGILTEEDDYKETDGTPINS